MIDYETLWESTAPKIFELSVTADTNDADYVTSTQTVSQNQIDGMLPIIEMIKNYKGHNYNWCIGDIARKGEGPKDIYPELTEEAFEWFSDFLPYGEYGIHTIESIEYYPLPEKVKLL